MPENVESAASGGTITGNHREEGAVVTIRTDERGRRLGNASDAARECRPRRKNDPRKSLDSPATYRRMVTQRGAPGPVGFSPVTGEQEYDLDAVRRWDREERTAVGQWRSDPTYRVPMRHETLRAAAAGELAVVVKKVARELHRHGVKWDGRVRLRMFGELERGGLLSVPEGGGRVSVTVRGGQVLERWDREVAAEEAEAARAG